MKITQKHRKPDWLKIKAVGGEKFKEVNQLLKAYDLQTVCHAANCPNRGECFDRGTATFLILGSTCTRNCAFCDINPGIPESVDLAELSQKLKLKHVVVTSVTRDDLPDGGANQFARTVFEIKKLLPDTVIELLTPDFLHTPESIKIIIQCKPDIFNHNLETVASLYPIVRPQADYQSSLKLLKFVSEHSDIRTKSGIMVGVGETLDELKVLFDDLYKHNVSILTIGQYLAPSPKHLRVEKYYHPDEFTILKQLAEDSGIPKVVSAPLVRSSYRADQI